MTDEHRQRLSELLDGELTSRSALRMLDRVEYDDALRATWERYHLIGQALRGEPIDPHLRTLAARIHDEIAAEPVPLRSWRSRMIKRPGIQYLGPFAMAASVAMVAVAISQMIPSDPFSSDPIPEVAEAAMSPPRLVERESIPMSRLQLEHPELASKLDLYLVTHQATAPAGAVRGMLPYATLVGYDSPR